MRFFYFKCFFIGLLFFGRVFAAPGDILFSDDFESGFGNWTTVGTGDASIGTETANSGTSSMRLRWDAITATSNIVNNNVPAAELSIWVRRGSDVFSEDPDANPDENLVLEYFNDAASWVGLETFAAATPAGEIFTRTYTLLPDALHANFRIRFRMAGASGGPPDNGGIGWDYWHVDDTVVTERAAPTPIAPGTCDDFESGFGNWIVAGSGDAGINTMTANSATQSMYTRWDTVNVLSLPVSYQSSPFATITLWVRRGSDVFSENPEAGEDMVIEYFNNANNWVVLETFAGNGTPGEALNRTYMLAADALHADFRLRFRQTGGSGGAPANGGLGWDYWHVDDVCFLDTSGVSPAAYYQMDESVWATPGDITDSSGSGNNANPVGSVSTASANPALAGNPGTCGYGVFPANNNTAVFDAVDSTITPGSIGSITFWYSSNTNWSGGGSGNQMLMDASADLGNNNADKYFFLVKRNNGRLRFRLEDSADTDSQAETGGFGFAANTWVHIALTWDLPNDRLQVYVNGALSATSTTNVNGTAAAWNSLYIGDNRSTGISGSGYTGNSANGLMDEVRVYNSAISMAVVMADMAATHPCSSTDHFSISHDGQGINCQAEPVTLAAHLADHSVDSAYIGLLNLSTSTSHGDWTIISGNGTLNNGAADDGVATYDMVATDMGQAVLGLKVTDVETVNINVSDGVISETSGTALAAEDQSIDYAEAGFVFLADSVANNIGTQIGGKSSAVAPGAQVMEIQAVRTNDSSGQCEVALQGVNTIELAFECRNPASCTSRLVNIDGGTATNIVGNPLAGVVSYTGVNLDFGNSADSTATFVMSYPDVGQVQLYARYNIPLDDGSATPSGNFMRGNSNIFVVKPFGFYVDVPGNAAATGFGGGVFTTADVDFTTSTTAVLWQAGDDSDNNGIPDNHDDNNPGNNAVLSNNTAALNYGQESPREDIRLTAQLDQPGGGNDPGLSGTTIINSFSNGAGSSTTVRYAEVGIIEISVFVNDGDYLGIGAASTTNTLSKSGYVGRFIPNHFDLSAGAVTNRVDLVCAPAATFTHLGEILRLELTLTAQTPTNVTTQNYIGGFAKLDLNTIGNLNFGAVDSAGPTPLSGRINPDSSSGIWVLGAANVLARAALNRAAAVDGPYSNLTWGAAPVDSDGVLLNAYDLDVDSNTVNDHGQVAVTDLRFGRAVVESIAGSERLALVLPVHTEYFNGTQFVRNISDSCSSYAATDLSFANRVGLSADPAAAGAGTFMQGTYDPLNPMTLGSSNETGNIDATLAVPAWLQFDWDADGNNDNDPSGHITFGVFGGSDRQIYTREVY